MPQVNVLGCSKLVLLPVVYGCALGTITSLIPRPFPPPAFHCLQSANSVGEGLGYLVTCNAIRYTEGRHTMQCPKKTVEVILVLTSRASRMLERSQRQTINSSLFTMPFACLPSAYVTSLHVTRYPRPSLAIFAYCLCSNSGSGNDLGTLSLCNQYSGGRNRLGTSSLWCIVQIGVLSLLLVFCLLIKQSIQY